MDEKKLDEVMSELRSMQDQQKKDREAFEAEQKREREALEAEKRAFEKEQASYKNNPGVQHREALVTQKREIIDAMMNKRAITLSGAGAVEVVGELFKVLRQKTGILEGVRYFQGANALTKIPVLNPRPAKPARYAEGATNVTADSTAALGHTDLEPETYVSVLPVSFEALKYSSVNLESELFEVIANSFTDAMAHQMVNGRGKTTYYEFGGLFTSVPAGNQIACASSGAPTIADLVKLALTMQDKVMSNPTIVISPTLYAGITTASVSGYDVYRNEIIMNRTLEGVKIEVCGYAPSTTTANSIVAVGFDKANYAIGVAADLTIKPLEKVGDTNVYFQAICGLDGKPIVAANLYGLKAISST